MESAYRSLSFKKGTKLVPILLIAATALIAFTLLAGYLLNMTSSDLPTDPPPIIIKSGSFIMESENAFQPDAADQRNYKNAKFNDIKGLRIITYSENPQISTIDQKFFEGKDSSWETGDNIQVNIYIQLCQPDLGSSLCTNWGSAKKVEVSNANGDLSIIAPPELHLSKNKKNKKNKRLNKNEDENQEFIRFYMVEIINKTKNTRIAAFPNINGQECYIGFYNTLAN